MSPWLVWIVALYFFARSIVISGGAEYCLFAMVDTLEAEPDKTSACRRRTAESVSRWHRCTYAASIS